MTNKLPIIALVLVTALSGCRTTQQAMLDSDQMTPEVRAMQTRTFDASSRPEMMRAAIQTLQDLNFEILDVNGSVGLIRAKKYTRNGGVNVNVNVKDQKNDTITVRMNANFNNNPVVEAEHYSKFFAALDKSVFIEGNM
jgi:protein-disulfide isomerase